LSEEKLTGVFRNQAGEIISFQTSNGRIISYRKALQEAEAGILSGIEIQETTNSNETLDYDFYNVDDLPDIY
jgi:hypothetical protein